MLIGKFSLDSLGIFKLNLFLLCNTIVNITNLEKATSDQFPHYSVKAVKYNGVHFRS